MLQPLNSTRAEDAKTLLTQIITGHLSATHTAIEFTKTRDDVFIASFSSPRVFDEIGPDYLNLLPNMGVISQLKTPPIKGWRRVKHWLSPSNHYQIKLDLTDKETQALRSN